MIIPPQHSFLRKAFLETKLSALNPPPAITVEPACPLLDAVAQMKTHRVGGLLVVENGAPWGIVTERDILRLAGDTHADLAATKVAEIATRSPEVLADRAGLGRALYLMAECEFRHLPVTGREGKLHMLSVKHVLSYIYTALTRRLVRDPLAHVKDQNRVDTFFETSISVLDYSVKVQAVRDTPLGEIISSLVRFDIGALAVVDDHDSSKLVGLFSERDFINKVPLIPMIPRERSVHEWMTTTVATIPKGATVSLAFNMMAEGGFRHLPLVDEYERLVGMLSVKNFIRHIARDLLAELSG